MRRLLSGLLKLGLSAAILTYLVWDATATGGRTSVFTTLAGQPKDWGLLAGAFLAFVAATLLTLVRWWHLARALGVPCRLGEVMRIGFWGLLFNLAPLGVVSGDLVKAVLLARKHPGQRPPVVASVLVDRVIGVYLLFVFVTAAILVTDFTRIPGPQIAMLCDAVFVVTAAGAVGLTVVMIPGISGGRGLRAVAGIPRVGPSLESLIQAVRLYRQRLPALGVCAALTLVVHALTSVSCYFIGAGLGGEVLPLADQFVVVPISIAASILPLPLGPFEFVLEFLYTELPLGLSIPAGQGLVVALVYRLIAILAAAAGVTCSFGERRQATEASRTAELV